MPETGKNIAIFCDGTWQHLDQRYPTNVANLARAVRPSTAGGDVQFVYYDDGVGVSQGVASAFTHLVGGMVGEGLDYKIVRAYEFLCLNYNPGDQIFIFGFSRGAYTARSLSGLLRLVWILKREKASRVLDATALYRTRPRQPVAQADQAFQDTLRKFRADHCYPGEPFVGDKTYDPTDSTSLVPANNCTWVQYVGVWDTVGSLGVPSNMPFAAQLDAKYQFYDTSLSRFVRSARHAVSIDEHRTAFAPTLWDNIDTLNVNAHASELAYTRRPYQQVWFPGGHSCVGGGGNDGGISLAAMLWVAEGAARAGLAFDDQQIERYNEQTHPNADFQGDGHGFLTNFESMSDRQGPTIFDEVSLSARLRWASACLIPPYRPIPLDHVAGDLANWQPPVEPPVYYAP